MTDAAIDLNAVAIRLPDRAPSRAEATVQSDVRLLLAARVKLVDGELLDVVLDVPAGKLRRIDVEVGATVEEVRRDRRVQDVRSEAVKQLAEYVRQQVTETGARYAGALTDGAA